MYSIFLISDSVCMVDSSFPTVYVHYIPHFLWCMYGRFLISDSVWHFIPHFGQCMYCILYIIFLIFSDSIYTVYSSFLTKRKLLMTYNVHVFLFLDSSGTFGSTYEIIRGDFCNSGWTCVNSQQNRWHKIWWPIMG